MNHDGKTSEERCQGHNSLQYIAPKHNRSLTSYSERKQSETETSTMGMCMCSVMTLPCLGVGGGTGGILWCVGEGKCGCCPNKNCMPVFTPRQKMIHLGLWLLVFLIGLLGFLLPMSMQCAEADGIPWNEFDWIERGTCWSARTNPTGSTLGVFAGIFCGIGAGGFLVTCCRCTTPVDDSNNHDDNGPPSKIDEKVEIDV